MLKYYFASANSGKGFINYFPQIFSSLEYHYIIKGGPGTGKSSLMKKIAEKAVSLGMDVDCYLCSSDPDSLDGVIIRDLSIGITDGTSPHSSDPLYPGAKGEIIDLGLCWDKSKIIENKAEIIELSDKKSREFRYSYSYLSAALKASRTKDEITSETADLPKIQSFAERSINKLDIKKGRYYMTLTDAITVKGHKILDTYTSDADQLYCVDDTYGISNLIFKCIKSLLDGYEFCISYDALDPEKINMIYIPSCKTLFSKNTALGKHINTKRFIDHDAYRSIKNRSQQTQKLIASFSDMAFQCLEEAGKYHFKLEDIYIKAMDFKKKEEQQNRLITEIFS